MLFLLQYVPVATASPYTLAPSKNSSTGANLTTQKINILIVNGVSHFLLYAHTHAHAHTHTHTHTHTV